VTDPRTREPATLSHRWSRHGEAIGATLRVGRGVADVGTILLAFALSYDLYVAAIRSGVLQRAVQDPLPYADVGVLFAAFALLSFWRLGLYRHSASVLNLWESGTVVKGLVLAAACFFAVLFFLRLAGYSRLVVVGAIGMATVLVLLERRVLSTVIRRLQLTGRLGRRVIIYGCGATGRLVMKKIVQAPHLGCRVVGFLDDVAAEGAVVECRVAQGGPVLRVPVLGRLEELPDIAARQDVDELFVTEGTGSSERVREILELAATCHVAAAVVPRLGSHRADQVQVEDLGAVPLLRMRQVPMARVQHVLKRGFDVVGAIALGIVTAPCWIAAWALLRFEGGGSILFAHERVGLEGRQFRLLKFRTMRPDTNPYASSPQSDWDPRVTRIGRLLRVTGLDELPQLINVLRGEMSLVGPRPEMPFIVDGYSPLERERLRVKPGITGLWQVSADRQAEIHENIEYDLYYVSHESLVLDALILLETAFFTAGLVLRTLMSGWPHSRFAQQVLQPLPEGACTREAPGASGPVPVGDPGAYVLVALDQRYNDGAVPQTWIHGIQVAAAAGRRWAVKVLAAAQNRATFDRLFAEVDRGHDWEDRYTTYVAYRARAELRELVMGARLVLTDLPHIAEWVRDAGRDLVWASPAGLQWLWNNGHRDEAVAELAGWVSAAAVPEVAVQ
jgi:exopolysaccharide biosynthesis polyprenyl glycosylphosphotransferase